MCTITNLSNALRDIETKLSNITDNLEPDYVDAVKSKTKHQVIETIDDYCESSSVKSLFIEIVSKNMQKELDDLSTDSRTHIHAYATESELKYKASIATITNERCAYMQEKANTITAQIENATCKQNDITATFHPTTERSPKHSINPLFPNVDPNLFSQDNPDQFKCRTEPQYEHNSQYQHRRYSPNDPTPDYNMEFQYNHILKDTEYVNYTDDETPQITEVNVNTFYKIRWNSKCTKELDVFHFYKTLQHTSSTCGIPMRDLSEIDENNGVCPLSPDNCKNYGKVYKLMKGTLFHKINDKKLFDGYNHGWNLVTSNLSDCDGFEVMLDLLSEILPRLNIKTTKSTKIARPQYIDIALDNIYHHINKYNAFLKFEALGSHKREYSPYEIAVYVANDLQSDPHN